jgi:hypothetical protein
MLHPVHVSVVNFEYVSQKKSASISVKVFPDDFELAFNHNYNIHLNLGKEDIHPEWQKYLTTYFSKMFLLKVNNKTSIPLVFDNYEVQDDGIMLHFNATINNKIKSIQIENALLLDVFENQTNLVILNIDGKEKGYSLNYGNYKIDLKI